MAEATILIADDEEDIRRAMSKIFKKEGYEVITAANGREAVKAVRERDPDLAFLDIRMPLQSGLDALEEIRGFNRRTIFIVLTAYLEQEYVSRAIQLGAYNYLVKPSKTAEIVALVKQALKTHESSHPEPAAPPAAAGFEEMIGDSAPMRDIFHLIERISHSDVTVLIQGESGTGKELVARAIHNNSLRKSAAYVTVDCGTLPDTLMESEIFGYEAGAFTDARKSKPGKFEMADGGTLFLDEIGNLSPAAQAKLLRALEDKKITRLGGKETKEVDVRIIAATNLDLEAATKDSFREDLYYRLNVFRILLPPLRDRPGDIPTLARHFTNRFAREQRKDLTGITDPAMALLTSHRWRGNVRELRNVIERAVLLADREIGPDHLPRDLGRSGADLSAALPASAGASAAAGGGSAASPGGIAIDPTVPLKHAKDRAVEQVERQYILDALRKCNWNKSEAAKMLDLNYKTLREKIKEYGLEKE